jgi:predicted NUDIX family NTP pyrophosphohydrolase
MPIHSAGILLYRWRNCGTEIFLIHPGGPYWAKKDFGAWSLPKGLIVQGEDRLAAARREFREETGASADGAARHLGTFRLTSSKQLTVWAVEGDLDPASLASNNFTMVWPPRSGTLCSFPEADRGAWFGRDEALARITKGQTPAIEKFYSDLSPGR